MHRAQHSKTGKEVEAIETPEPRKDRPVKTALPRAMRFPSGGRGTQAWYVKSTGRGTSRKGPRSRTAWSEPRFGEGGARVAQQPQLEPEDAGTITVRHPMIVFGAATMVNAPNASAKLDLVSPSGRPALISRLLEMGAEADDLSAGSSTLQLIEQQISGFNLELERTLAQTLADDRPKAAGEVARVLSEYETRINDVLRRYLDGDSVEGIHHLVTRRLEAVGDALVVRVAQLLSDGDDGALGKLGNIISLQIRESTNDILGAVAARRALVTQSALSGRPYEDQVAARVAAICEATGDRTERVGDTLGVKRRKSGDVLITIDHALTNGADIRIAVESKLRSGTQKFSSKAVTSELRLARENREAVAALFVAESTDILPGGIPFGSVSDTDFFAVFDPALGDDLGLAVAIRLARVAALRSVVSAATAGVDLEAALSATSEARRLLTTVSPMIERNAKMRKDLDADDADLLAFREAVFTALRKVDLALGMN